MIGRVLGPVDETDQVAVVEVLEAVDLIDWPYRPGELDQELRRQLEAEVHPGSPDVEEDIAGGGDRVARPGLDIPEWVELRRAGAAEEPVPGG